MTLTFRCQIIVREDGADLIICGARAPEQRKGVHLCFAHLLLHSMGVDLAFSADKQIVDGKESA